MPKLPPVEFPWRCHWSHIDVPKRTGQPAAKATVWVCEHPYRTLRPSGPSAECEGCPNRVHAAGGPPQDPAPDPFARLASKLIH